MGYEKMTIPQLVEENRKFMAEKAEIKTKQMKLVAVMEGKIAVATAKKKVEDMSPAEKKIATQILVGAGGIKSEEKVGTPGAKA